VAAEYQEAFGEHAYDEHGNYIGDYTAADFTPETEAQAAWADYVVEHGVAHPDAPEGQGEPAPEVQAAPQSTNVE
jgi:small subunit ribosomal protein S1